MPRQPMAVLTATALVGMLGCTSSAPSEPEEKEVDWSLCLIGHAQAADSVTDSVTVFPHPFDSLQYHCPE